MIIRRSYALLNKTSMRILSEADVRRCLSISAAIAANKKALSSLTSNEDGGALVPTRIGLPYTSKESHDNDTAAPADWSLFKPAAYYPPQQDGSDNTDTDILMGVKVVSPRANNASKNKPTCPATIMLLNAETGETSAIVAATYLTAARTAAGSALATEMACSGIGDGLTLVVFGAGLQGELHIKAIQHVVNVKKVVIVNRSKDRAEKLKESLLSIDAEDIEHDSKTKSPIKDVSIVLLSDKEAVQQAVEIADVIVTATNTCEPLFSGNWPKPGCHINGVGSYTPLMKEIDDVLVNRCEVMIDTKEALDVGDLSTLRNNDDGATKHNCIGLIGDALTSTVEFGKDKNNNIDCTFFKSVGTAIQDVVTAQFVYEYATKEGIGTTIDM